MIRLALKDEEGSTLVETAVSCALLMMIIIGILQTCLALYAYHYTAQVARMATRYAMVRGSSSCTNTPNLPNCNATPTEITGYVQGLGFPGIASSNVSVATTWCASSGTTPVTFAACSSTTANDPGNAVQVVVSYPYSLAIPFIPALRVNVSSTSQSIISQ